MVCPRNSFGQPECHIVPHPDRPGEDFCATCRKRFYENDRMPFPLAVLLTVLLIALLGGIEDPNSSRKPPSELQQSELVTGDRHV